MRINLNTLAVLMETKVPLT